MRRVDHDDLVAEFGALLAPAHRLSRDLPEGCVSVQLPAGTLGAPIVAIPDCHLADGSDGDEFLDGDATNAARLEAVLRALWVFLARHPESCALQLGDWFDLWRAEERAVDGAAVYRSILELDAGLGLRHLVGNHDASFVNALPARSANDRGAFMLGDWIGPSLFALHGHQADAFGPDHEAFDELVVGAATAIARFVPGVRTFEAFVDSDLGAAAALSTILHGTFGVPHGDPPPAARRIDTRPGAPDAGTTFSLRENADVLAAIVANVATQSKRPMPKAIVVGHSHNPCIAWSNAAESPVVIVDAGACVFGRFNLLLGAGDRLTVFDVL